MRPVPHSDDLPVLTPPVNKDLLSSSDEEIPSREDSAESISLEDIESTYSGTSGNEPHWITQEDLNDLARDLYLSKQQSELLASRGYGVPNVTQDSFSPFPLQLLPAKPWSSE